MEKRKGEEFTWRPPAASTLSPNSMTVIQMRSSRTRKITKVPKIPSISSCYKKPRAEVLFRFITVYTRGLSDICKPDQRLECSSNHDLLYTFARSAQCISWNNVAVVDSRKKQNMESALSQDEVEILLYKRYKQLSWVTADSWVSY